MKNIKEIKALKALVALKGLKAHYIESRDDYNWNPYGDQYNIFLYAKDVINQFIKNLRCKFFGHKWTCDQDITPDSGTEILECTCCGECQINTYY